MDATLLSCILQAKYMMRVMVDKPATIMVHTHQFRFGTVEPMASTNNKPALLKRYLL